MTDVNEATELVTGYNRSELIGTDFSDYFTEPEKAREGYKHVFQEGSVLDYALEIQHRSRKTTPVLYNASVYRDEYGGVIGVFAAARDITELKKAQKELELASKYNRSLIEASLDPLVTIGPDGRITDVNEATESVTGYSRKELIGTDFSNYFTEPEKAKEGYKQVFREGWCEIMLWRSSTGTGMLHLFCTMHPFIGMKMTKLSEFLQLRVMLPNSGRQKEP
uniref:PAS domain-containing protein n=1 Tax=Methanosarcina horonobensis TaxID=418008 RepID=UPI002FCE1F1D